MSRARQATGRAGEAAAAAWLTGQGWRVRDTNWRHARGEIDLVAEDGDTLVVVEVRTRTGRTFGAPEESIGARKRRKLVTLAESYVQSIAWPGPWRIDVVAVLLGRDGSVERLTLYRNAVGAG